ncbi:hypothetical protein DPMN_116497 [Dreissena polymorpha]|uniref:HAT C-terminal dimerisation domain-containing protein n=2 Tax=Dreissena polymorpha TaxID=45954 RepID=A0A9D4KNP2_DREPO|nr:hypothetical protein DPMN_116497 [Dreissena polymorpha]
MLKQYAGEPQPDTEKSVHEPVAVPMCDRISNAEATTLAVAAEHGMPLSYVPILIGLAKSLAKDPKALAEVKLDRTAAAYKTKYGLAEGFHQKLMTKLRQNSFSINLDEATSSNRKKVLTMLVSFYDDEVGQVKIEHLASVEIKKTDSETVFKEVVKVIEGNEIPWKNLVSVLMDSCGVMRGNKNGVETRLRLEKAPHLLDVDGDSCHHMHNCSKKLCEPFTRYLESLFNDVHADFQYCSEYAEMLAQICAVIVVTYCKPARFIPHRWLSAYDLSVQTTMLLDAYVLFYYSFMKNEDRQTYKEVVDQILSGRGVHKEGQRKLKDIQERIAAKKMTQDGKERKKRIIEKVLLKDTTTKLQLSFYCAVMHILKQYVCTFQSSNTMVHQLHEEQFRTFKEFLACFMKSEAVVNLTPKQAKVMRLDDPQVTLKPKSCYVGAQAELILKNSSKSDSHVQIFLSQVKDAYIQCASQMQKTLPLNNRTLKSLAALDPALANDSQGVQLLKQLALDHFKHLLSESEKADVARELIKYSVDDSLHSFRSNVVEWWSKVSARKCYPILSKVAAAGLSIFHGPAVESSFNSLGDIVDSKAASMEIGTYSAYQTVRYALKARQTTALEYFNRKDAHNNKVVDRHLCVNMRLSAQRYKKVQLERRQKKAMGVGKKLQTVKAVKEQLKSETKLNYENHIELELARAKKRKMEERLTELAKKKRLQ